MNSAIYEGTLRHARVTPIRHAFTHRLYMLALDLDELADLTRSMRLFGHERARVTSLRDRDYLTAPSTIRRWLAEQGIQHDDGRTILVTHARVFGYVFNPVSFFHCLAPDGTLRAIVAEVNNTFGDEHRYLLTARDEYTDKLLHVSPFNDLRMAYRWRVGDLGPRHRVDMDVLRHGKSFFHARLDLARRPLTDAQLASTLIRYPMIPLRVTAWIHLQALRLYAKGAPFHHAPPYDPESARRMHDREGSHRPARAHDQRVAGAPPARAVAPR